MDTLPPVRASRRFPPMFWLTIAFLAPASILRLVTIQASWWCIDDASFSKGEVLAILVFGYALLLSLVWLFRTIPPALAVVAVGTVVITWLELGTALTVGIHWTAYCGEASLGSGLFAMLQDVAAVFVGVLACAAWLYHRSRSRPRSGTITEL